MQFRALQNLELGCMIVYSKDNLQLFLFYSSSTDLSKCGHNGTLTSHGMTQPMDNDKND